MEAIFHGFDDKAAGSICENPVELSTGEVFAELCVGQIHAGEFSTGFFQSSALAENPWDEFELGYVFFIRDRISTMQSSVWLIFPTAIHFTTTRSMKRDSAWPD